MLPSRARAAIREHAYQSLLKARLNTRGQPIYSIVDLIRDMEDMAEDVTFVLKDMAYEEFQAAEQDFDQKHPICWDNDLQQSYRVIDGQRKAYR